MCTCVYVYVYVSRVSGGALPLKARLRNVYMCMYVYVQVHICMHAYFDMCICVACFRGRAAIGGAIKEPSE